MSHPLSPRTSASLPLVLLAGLLAAQTRTPEKPQEIPTFGATTELVYLRFHVEKKGGYLDSLKPEQIRVLEDGKPQPVAILETPSVRERTIPAEITFALDVSSSVMEPKLIDEALVRDVFFASLNESSRVGMCAFGGELRCFVEPTREVEKLMLGFSEAMTFGWEQRRTGTRLYASIADMCRSDANAPKTQRAIVVFSDGLDNRDGKVSEAVKAADEADIRVYAIKVSQAFQEGRGMNTGLGIGQGNRALYDYKKFDLDKLAGETGGKTYEPGTLDRKSLSAILRSIATEITMENVVGYRPEGAATGQKHKVRVELVDKSLGSIKDGERTLVR
jgi:VWFA-related protein